MHVHYFACVCVCVAQTRRSSLISFELRSIASGIVLRTIIRIHLRLFFFGFFKTLVEACDPRSKAVKNNERFYFRTKAACPSTDWSTNRWTINFLNDLINPHAPSSLYIVIVSVKTHAISFSPRRICIQFNFRP